MTAENFGNDANDSPLREVDSIIGGLIDNQGVVSTTCPICGRKEKNMRDLKLHLENHAGLRPHLCKICGKAYKDEKGLYLHRRRKHGKKRFVCTICNKAFPIKTQLEEHMPVHTNERPYKCQLCPKDYKHVSHLSRHYKTDHTNFRPTICPVCGQAFIYDSELTIHLHTHNGERPYVCEECGESFARGMNLIRHIRIHTGERPFKCEKCGRRFVQKRDADLHIKYEACWYEQIVCKVWEKYGFEIAMILISPNVEWQLRIKIGKKKYIRPDIVDRTTALLFIDTKRSQKLTYKDVHVYPKIADKVIFWTLYGKPTQRFDDNPKITMVSSDQLIKQLEAKITPETRDTIMSLIKKIKLLKQGLDEHGQSLLSYDFKNPR